MLGRVRRIYTLSLLLENKYTREVPISSLLYSFSFANMPGTITQSASLPIFDFAKFLNGQNVERKKIAIQLVEAFKTYGFVYLINHGISDEKTQGLFDWVRIAPANIPEDASSDNVIEQKTV